MMRGLGCGFGDGHDVSSTGGGCITVDIVALSYTMSCLN